VGIEIAVIGKEFDPTEREAYVSDLFVYRKKSGMTTRCSPLLTLAAYHCVRRITEELWTSQF